MRIEQLKKERKLKLMKFYFFRKTIFDMMTKEY